MEIIVKENLVENSAQVGAAMLQKLQSMKEKYRFIGDVRGKGLMLGLELVKDKGTKELLSKEITLSLFHQCLRARPCVDELFTNCPNQSSLNH